MKITGLKLLTNNLEATVDFYSGILGLEYAGGEELTAIFKAGTTTLTFLYSEAISHPVYHFAFTLPANKLQEAFSNMSGKVDILTIPSMGKIADFSNWNAHAFYFHDNNGNIVEYIVRHDLHNDSALPYSGRDICSISEIGLVADDVPLLADRLQKEYGLTIFPKQPPQEKFTVIGDDEGLLILAATHRSWYPTAYPAAAYPLDLCLVNDAGKQFMFSYGYK